MLRETAFRLLEERSESENEASLDDHVFESLQSLKLEDLEAILREKDPVKRNELTKGLIANQQ